MEARENHVKNKSTMTVGRLLFVYPWQSMYAKLRTHELRYPIKLATSGGLLHDELYRMVTFSLSGGRPKWQRNPRRFGRLSRLTRRWRKRTITLKPPLPRLPPRTPVPSRKVQPTLFSQVGLPSKP